MNTINKFSVIDSFNVLTPPTEICNKLGEIINDIWKNSLTKEHFFKLTEIFIKNDDLSLSQRKVILECLIPQFVIEEGIVKKLLLWFYSNYIIEPQAASCLLCWLAVILKYNLIDSSYLELNYNQLVSCFQSECLVTPLCDILILITNEKTTNRRSAFLVEEFYKEFNNNSLKNLLWEIKKYRPNDVVLKFNNQPHVITKVTDFEKAIIKAARKQGINNGMKVEKLENPIPGNFPAPEYLEDNSSLKKLTNLSSAIELGRSISKLNLEKPINHLSLIGSKMGMTYLETFGPNEEFFETLQGVMESQPSQFILSKLSELQNSLRHGLPPITKYLGDFLITWDGTESQSLVYDLIKWAHFDTFTDLYSLILEPLARLYFSANIEIKVGILKAIENLLINMVSIHMERLQSEKSKLDDLIKTPKWLDDPMSTFLGVCSYVQSLLLKGIMLEGLDSSSLILEATSFYNVVITLQLEFSLICLITPSPPIMYAALTSTNHIVLSEVGSLMIRYKKQVIPFLDSLEKTEEFSSDIELIYDISENMFNYLWHGKKLAARVENNLVDRSVTKNYVYSENVLKHLGVFPLIEFLSKKLRINPRKLKKEDILLMLIEYSEGLGEFIQYHLKNIGPAMNEDTNNCRGIADNSYQ